MKIFWSWQSDNDEKCGHYFVRDVLDSLVIELNNVDETVEAIRGDDIGPVSVDHDTKDVPGSPPIAETILKKISNAAVFIADVTPVGKATSNEKRIANPNVMFELGYAISALGNERVILLMNKAEHKELNTLPFDVRHWRGPVVYDLPSGSSKEIRDNEAKKLKQDLKRRLEPSLRAAVQAMKERTTSFPIPKFKVALEKTNSELLSNLSQQASNFEELSLDALKIKYPRLPLPDREFTAGFSKSLAYLGAQLRPSDLSREDTELYNRRLNSFYKEYEQYLEETAKYRELLTRTIEVKIVVENTGDLPATDIDTTLTFPDNFTLLSIDEPPNAPAPPEPPSYSPHGLTQVISADYSNFLNSIQIYSGTDVDADNRRVGFHLERLKHGNFRTSDSFLLIQANTALDNKAVIKVRVSAAECRQHLQEELEFKFS